MVTAPTHKALATYHAGGIPTWWREFTAFLVVLVVSFFISTAIVSVAYRVAISGNDSSQVWVEPRAVAVATASYQQDAKTRFGSLLPLNQAVIKETAKDRR